jgi:hypothetical protein
VLGFIGTWLQQHLTIASYLNPVQQSRGGVEGRMQTATPPPALKTVMDPSSYREGVYDRRDIDKGVHHNPIALEHTVTAMLTPTPSHWSTL